MEFKSTNSSIFPEPVSRLLKSLSSVAFFEESVLIGSWVMPLYREFFSVSYTLRTLDIDFAVQLLPGKRSSKTDLHELIISQGFAPFLTQSGVEKFSKEGFSIEFIAHRRGGRDEDPVFITNWNISAIPLPFVDILIDSSFVARFPEYIVRAPLPEAFFFHKLITAERRREQTKRAKDLEQCAAIAPHLDQDKLRIVCKSVKLGPGTRSAIRSSCKAIDFPPQFFGLKE
ncbi:MAG TPA: GSU2403 family nucleotidyltransferase fold protein [Syntrophorhabdaceae bacterium]|nr:GSU2403 family nucleotidyltransferase fold protein [Syntrophorhabdaceae bacterium]